MDFFCQSKTHARRSIKIAQSNNEKHECSVTRTQSSRRSWGERSRASTAEERQPQQRQAAENIRKHRTCSRILLKEPPKTSRSKVATTVQQNTTTPMINPIICGDRSMMLAQRALASAAVWNTLLGLSLNTGASCRRLRFHMGLRRVSQGAFHMLSSTQTDRKTPSPQAKDSRPGDHPRPVPWAETPQQQQPLPPFCWPCFRSKALVSTSRRAQLPRFNNTPGPLYPPH